MSAVLPLWSGFAACAERFPGRAAVDAAGRVTTYGALFDAAAAIAATLRRVRSGPTEPLTAVLVERDATGFAAILGALMSGTGYVPMNPRVPAPRLAVMLERAGCGTLVADAAEHARLREILAMSPGVEAALLTGAADASTISDLRASFPRVRFVVGRDLSPASEWSAPTCDPDSPAYLLFTSGSTGTPKGVAVAHRSIRRFLDVVGTRYRLTPDDRFSQLFELVFDLSLFDLFAAWEVGAVVCCPDAEQSRIPASYVRDARLTVWFSVPSTAVLLRRLGLLTPAAFPNLRTSLFCGEALPADAAAAWADAAPNSTVENLYGPTEATLACTAYVWDRVASARSCENGIVPIGAPFPGMTARVVDEALRESPSGEPGELLVSGPQLALGYWRDPETTAARFVRPLPGDPVHYRTGDRVRRAADGALHHLGRLDDQIKVRGHRVELGDVEAAVRRASGAAVVVAVGWPRKDGSAQGLVAFLETEKIDAPSVRRGVAALVPSYMVPARFIPVPAMPLNPNGKVDRKALDRLLESPLNARDA